MINAPTTSAAEPTTGLAALRPLLGEINDLKRVRAAGWAGSLASIGFTRSWAALVGGEDTVRVAVREAARAVAAARLGGIDAAVLGQGGLSAVETAEVLRGAIDAVGVGLDAGFRERLKAAVCEPDDEAKGDVPGFVALLEAQPRAGATRPGHPRLVLEPPESHAEHCYVTAVYGVLLSPAFGAEPATPFLAGLAHHLHNAGLPDSGFAGEELLGPHLDAVMARFTARALATLPSGLAGRVENARRVLDGAGSPEARAFHAADVLDRVLQMVQYHRVAAFELSQALDDLDLVHPGPLLAFQTGVLSAAGLRP